MFSDMRSSLHGSTVQLHLLLTKQKVVIPKTPAVLLEKVNVFPQVSVKQIQ